jgi:hypothetical protein
VEIKPALALGGWVALEPSPDGTMVMGELMRTLVLFTFATTGVASGTVTTLEFSTQQFCLIAARELQALTKPIVSGGITRYEVAGTCVQTSDVPKKCPLLNLG